MVAQNTNFKDSHAGEGHFITFIIVRHKDHAVQLLHPIACVRMAL